MKNLLVVFLAVLGFSTFSAAQTNIGVQASVGVTLAPNETTYSGEVFDYINHEVTYKGSNIVKSYGLFAQQKFGYLFGRAELSYMNYKQDYNVRSFVQFGQGTRKVVESYDFIDLQVMGGLNINGIRIGVGPVAHVMVGHDTGLDIISGFSENTRKVTYGFATGVGLDAGRFHLDLRYINNFKTVGEHIYYGSRNAGFKVKPHVVNLTLGFSI